MYYYVYVLLSEKDNQFYTGYTCNLKERMFFHNEGKVGSTKNRGPLKLIYFEGCLNQQDATRREKYLKSGNGKIYLRKRLANFLNPKYALLFYIHPVSPNIYTLLKIAP